MQFLLTNTVRWSCRLAALGLLAALTTASPAWAEGEEGGSAKEKIRKQMEKIRTLMAENETALLDLSAGKKAETKHVDVDVPQPDGKSNGSSGGDNSGSDKSGGEGSSGESAGESAEKTIDELLRKQAESAESIPGEIERLVKMIPL